MFKKKNKRNITKTKRNHIIVTLQFAVCSGTKTNRGVFFHFPYFADFCGTTATFPHLI